MIVDGRGGAEVWYRESRQDHRPRVLSSRSSSEESDELRSRGRGSWHVGSSSSL
jgi:hypothetical protein